MGVNEVKRRVAVVVVAAHQALSVLAKALSPLEVTHFDRVMWRVRVET